MRNTSEKRMAAATAAMPSAANNRVGPALSRKFVNALTPQPLMRRRRPELLGKSRRSAEIAHQGVKHWLSILALLIASGADCA
jgi:hypothetical protein